MATASVWIAARAYRHVKVCVCGGLIDVSLSSGFLYRISKFSHKQTQIELWSSIE